MSGVDIDLLNCNGNPKAYCGLSDQLAVIPKLTIRYNAACE